MAWRYLDRLVESGGIVSSMDWNSPMSGYIGEFNGMLDRDNFPNAAVDYEHTTQGAFTKTSVSGYHDDGTPVFWGTGQVLWRDAGSGGLMPTKTLYLPVDCVVAVEFGCWFEWWGASAFAEGDDDVDRNEHVVQFRVVANGDTVCESGIIPMFRNPWSVWLVGATVCSAGEYTFTAEARSSRRSWSNGDVFRPPQHGFKVISREMIITEKRR